MFSPIFILMAQSSHDFGKYMTTVCTMVIRGDHKSQNGKIEALFGIPKQHVSLYYLACELTYSL